MALRIFFVIVALFFALGFFMKTREQWPSAPVKYEEPNIIDRSMP